METRKRRQPANQAAFERALAALNPDVALQQEIVAARTRAGLSQSQLAQRMDTTQSAIARLETGRNRPSIVTLRKLAEATDSRLVVRLDTVPPRSKQT